MTMDGSELDTFNSRMLERIEDNPQEIKRFLRSYSNVVKRDVRKAYKAKGVKTKSGKLLQGIKSGKIYNDGEWKVRVYNRAPHAHLIEDGHEIVGHKPLKKGTDKFTKAYKVIENATSQGQYNKAVEKWVDTVIAKGWR